MNILSALAKIKLSKLTKRELLLLTFSVRSAKIKTPNEDLSMRAFFRAVLVITVFVTSFFIGFNLGRSKEKAKIPNFQEDTEGIA
jgi:uncharacterized membrane protein (Fun14 family)